MLTWIEDSRPEKLTLEVRVCVESDVEVEYTQILYLESENRFKVNSNVSTKSLFSIGTWC